MTVGLIIVAAGAARRMGGIDKVWAPLAGKPLVQWSIDRLAPGTDRVVVVVRSDDVVSSARRLILPDDALIVAGGAERADSVRAGLAALGEIDVVAIHDAARPFAYARFLDEGISRLAAADGAVPVEPVRDTIKQVGARDRIVRTVDRRDLRAAQTPQVFHAPALRRAHAAAAGATDDSALVEEAGGIVVSFAGAPENFKVTTMFDLSLARLLAERCSP